MARSREEIFADWVPVEGVWSPWAIPVLFAQMADSTDDERPRMAEIPSPPEWSPRGEDKRVVIVDLASESSVSTGLALATAGFRPVPLYNGCHGQNEVIDQTPIMQALASGAEHLASLAISSKAPPAFMLDARRMNDGYPVSPGMFDNRWKVFPQDFPSAEFLLSRAMQSCLVVHQSDAIAEDLLHVLRRWQEAGIAIWSKAIDGAEPATIVEVPRPAKYRSVWYRAAAQEELRRNVKGGFGYIIPEPSRG
jgi:hypothetical protein